MNNLTTAEICAQFNLTTKGYQLLREEMGVREFAETLMQNKQYVTGIDFAAHALAPREGIWWGCLCLQHACGDKLSAGDREATRAAVRWVMQPDEENRVAAKAPAEAAGPLSPAGALAQAANQTGGNLAPPKAPRMPPDPFAPAKHVATAVKLLCAKAEPVKIIDTQKLFVELGITLMRNMTKDQG